jgi:hypothetical protein
MLLDTGFRPSRNGFGFANSFDDVLLGVVPSRGRCGGMVFAALDAWASGRELDAEAMKPELPPYDAPLSRAIWQRQVASVVVGAGVNMWEFVRFTYVPTALGIGIRSREDLLPLFDLLRSGRPAPLGLVSAIVPLRLAANHQVLAYAAYFGHERAVLHLYDPNYPRGDDVRLEVPFDPTRPVVERVGGSQTLWRGFFIERYAPRVSDNER